MINIFYIFVGHMIYDLLYVETVEMKIHHIICISIPLIYDLYLKYLFEPTYADTHFVFTGLVILESTSPLVNCVWFLQNARYPNTLLHMSIKLAAALYWTIMRIIILPYVIYTSGSFYSRMFLYPFVPLNIFWFHLILKRAHKEIISYRQVPKLRTPEGRS